MINDVLLKIITSMHVLFVIAVITIPFIDSNYFLMLHAVFLPFIMLHWICNDNTCVLTLVERYLRKKIYKNQAADDDCITCKLIEPVYNFRNDYKTFTVIIYIITISLWFASAGRLYYKYASGDITHYTDLFQI
jgi:hypothetical protein